MPISHIAGKSSEKHYDHVMWPSWQPIYSSAKAITPLTSVFAGPLALKLEFLASPAHSCFWFGACGIFCFVLFFIYVQLHQEPPMTNTPLEASRSDGNPRVSTQACFQWRKSLGDKPSCLERQFSEWIPRPSWSGFFLLNQLYRSQPQKTERAGRKLLYFSYYKMHFPPKIKIGGNVCVSYGANAT